MSRKPDWPKRLAVAIDAARAKPFVYGEHDCMLFAADVVHAITGIDYGAQFRGTYYTEEGAYTIIAQYGSMEAMLTAILGSEPEHPSTAMRGDVVIADVPKPTCGICLGVQCAFPTEAGLKFHPRSVARLAWRID